MVGSVLPLEDNLTSADQNVAHRQYLDRIRTTAGPFALEEIDGEAVVDRMDSMKIL